MSQVRPLLICVLLAAATLTAQTSTSSVQAVGTATITVNPPDQAQFTVGVVTQSATAQDAAQQNATQTTTMINALKAVIGTKGIIQTVNYSVSPRYNNSNNPSIVGYSASNTLQVTANDISMVGSLIDVANQNGANNVSGVSFGLQNPEPVLQQALSQASKQALAHATAIASGLGGKIGSVLSAVEGANYTPMPISGGIAASTVTPIQAGSVSISATVTVTVQLVQ